LKRYKPGYPGESDRKFTHKIKEAGLLMDIQLLDHLIILPVEGYYSFADDKQSSPS
jgi:DNA repair protein RadC